MSTDNIEELLAEETPNRDIPEDLIPSSLNWTQYANCKDLLFTESGQVDKDAIMKFFVAAGHVISPEIRQLCLTCPVRRECLVHSFLGHQGDMTGAGYFAGFSHGQRKAASFAELLEIVDRESGSYRISNFEAISEKFFD